MANTRQRHAPVEREDGEGEHGPHRDGGDGEHPEHEEAVDGVGAGAAGGGETALDAVDVADRREAAADPGDGLEGGRHGPLLERVDELLVPDAVDLVALERAQRGAHGRLLLEGVEHREGDDADRGEQPEDAEGEHVRPSGRLGSRRTPRSTSISIIFFIQ